MSHDATTIILDEGLGPWFTAALVISFALHLVFFFGGLVVGPLLEKSPPTGPTVYTVNLVTLPQAAPEPEPTASAALPAPAAPQEPARLIPLGRQAPDAPRPQELKKKAPRPTPAINRRRPDPAREIDQALSRLKKSQQDTQPPEKRVDSAIAGLSAGRPAGGALSQQSGRAPTELESRMNDYYVVMENIINANWNQPPESLLKKARAQLETIVVIQIAPSGQVLKKWFEKKSGDLYFDKSVERAIARANPLPPLPEGFDRPYFELGFRFTPAGLGKKR